MEGGFNPRQIYGLFSKYKSILQYSIFAILYMLRYFLHISRSEKNLLIIHHKDFIFQRAISLP